MMKFLKSIIILFLLFVAGAYLFLRVQLSPYGEGGVVLIPTGASVSTIARQLEQAGVLRNAWFFKLLVRWEGAEKSLQSGEYQFAPQVRPQEILFKLRSGDRIVYHLTLPEGYTFAQIAAAIAQTGLASEAQVRAAFQDPEYLALLKFPATSLEGYLFPSTYIYDRTTTLDQLLRKMLQTFQNQLAPEVEARLQAMGWTIPQWVTLASIIEKETGQADERPLIASVFHNRLQKGMLLQSDPTIIYGLENFDGNLRRKDIRNPHPYNTYVHAGLPPTPIASPGKESLQAVLYPAKSEYLFFVAKGDGSHYFSKTLAEHNAAVRKYQLGISD